MGEAATVSVTPGRHQRRLRNYLLDSHFQLKYSGYLVVIAVALSVSLGLILWRTSLAVIEQSHEAVDQGEQVVSLGREVVKESQKVSAVVQMNIVKDPVYADNPALAEAFKIDAAVQDERLREQQDAARGAGGSAAQTVAEPGARQRTMFTTLLAVLTLLVVLIGFAGIVVTHKVAGPIYKMKRQIKAVARRPPRGAGKAAQGRRAGRLLRGFPRDGAQPAQATGTGNRAARRGDRHAGRRRGFERRQVRKLRHADTTGHQRRRRAQAALRGAQRDEGGAGR